MNNILVLDGNPFIRYLLARTLQSPETTVVTVSRLERAAEELRVRPYELFFVDMQMLNHSPAEILKTMKDSAPAVKIMLMSAAFGRDDVAVELQELIQCVIPKPFFPSDIRKLVGKTLGLGGCFSREQLPADRTFVERRRQERTPVMETIEYTVRTMRRGTLPRILTGDVINISETGLAMLTEYPIASGAVLSFRGGVEYHEGIVAWSRKVDNKTYSAGIVFV